MARQVHLFDRPDRFIAGTVGQPGDRTFSLQATGEGRTVSVALEKVQVTLLADRLEELLGEVQRRLGVPAPEEPAADDNEPLDTPVDEEFRVGAMGLAWDGDAELVVVEAQGVRGARPPGAGARALVDGPRGVVSAGRPPCPLCGLPLDSGGHVCPRQN